MPTLISFLILIPPSPPLPQSRARHAASTQWTGADGCLDPSLLGSRQAGLRPELVPLEAQAGARAGRREVKNKH